jgi:ABC-type uncharacterized transport system substrate-binding protein
MVFAVLSALWTPTSLFGAELHKPRIAIFTPGLGLAAVHKGMEEGLNRLGYIDGKSINFLLEDTKGSTADLSARAATLMGSKPDLLFTVTIPHTMAAKQATSSVPVVFAWVGNPVSAGLVAYYPYSKSNVTGVTSTTDSLSGKRLEVLLEIAPKAKRLLVIVASNESVSTSSFQSLDQAAKKLGVKLVRHDVTSDEEIKTVLDKTSKGSVDAIFNTSSILVRSNIDLLINKSKLDRIPLSVNEDGLVDRGALTSYGPDSRLIGRQAANLINKILSGAKPGEIMVEPPDRFFFAINQTTAKQIGLTISRGILERADRVIQ